MNRFRARALSLATPADKPDASLTVEDITPPDNPGRLLGLIRRYLETGDGDVDLRDDVVKLLACIETLELAALRLTILAARLDTTEEHLGLLQATVNPIDELLEHLLAEIREAEHEETSSEAGEFDAEAAELASQQLMYLAVQGNPVLAAEAVQPMNAMALRLEQETLEADAANAD